MKKLFAIFAIFLAMSWTSTVVADHTPDPASITIPGNLQDELGCPGDWQPDCAATHLAYDNDDDVWQGTFSIPAGSWEYKAALNDSWTENYGAGGVANGPNIPLNLGAPTDVKFYYDHKSHWVTDNVNSVIATVPGSFQSAIGCSGDWQPDCLRSWLQDPDGDGTYSFSSSGIPAGSYEAKVAHDESWAENYGAGGVPNGPNIPFTVGTNETVTFEYDLLTHILTITTQADLLISEIRIDQPSTDNDEYFELSGTPGRSLDGLTYLVIGDGAGGSGVIEAVVALTGQTIPASGFFVAAEGTFTLGTADLTTDLNFENSDNVTHLLVRNFTGANGDDLDMDDDGVLDITPWSELLDCVALVETIGSGEQIYCGTTVGPDGSFVPGHVYVCPDGWQIGAFDPAGGSDTPGAANACPDLTAIELSEIRIDQAGTDNDEYFELSGTPGRSLDGLTYLVIGDGAGGSGVIEAVVALTGQTIPASGFFVAAEGTFTLGTADFTTSLNFENSDNVTHLLVRDFTGANGDDLDMDDDGVLDSVPWSELLDCVGLIETVGSGDQIYCGTTVGPDGSFVPGHVYVCPDGWQIGAFDPAGGSDTPGAANACEPTPPNSPPIADAGGPYSLDEGGSVQLDASGTSDPDQPSPTLTYEWDFDNDGAFDDATGISPTFSAVDRDGPSALIVDLRVTDAGGLSDTESATIDILNVAPSADAGPDQTVFRNDSVSVGGAWTDPATMLDEPYAWAWDLDGDGLPDVTGSASYGETISKMTSFTGPGQYTLTFSVTDKDGGVGTDSVVVEVLNRPPVCSNAEPSIETLWPPNHRFVPVSVLGVTDPEGDNVVITIDSIFQDEPVDSVGDGLSSPDAQGVGTGTAEVRAERSGSSSVSGNGRVYHITFTAEDEFGATCQGEVLVGVPKSQGKNKGPIDDGALFDSTAP